MAQVSAVGTVTDPLGPPGSGAVARDPFTGYLYVLLSDAANTLSVYRSINAGGSWSLFATFSQTGLAEWSSLVIDGYWGHFAYRVSTTGGGGTDTIWYRRMTLGSTGSISPGLRTSEADANGGVAGATWQGVDIAVVRNATGSYTIAVVGARTVGTSRYGIQIMVASITSGGDIYLNNPQVSGARAWWVSGTAPGRSGVVAELEHNGNGINGGTPNLWVCWGRARLEMVKLAWVGNGQGWNGPTSSVVIRSSLASSQDFATGRWDGSQWMMAVPSPDDTTRIRIYQRNKANTQTVTYDTPVHPTGVVRTIGLSYDATSKNLRVYAVGTSTAVVYFTDYVRATSTWNTWVQANGATAVLGATEWALRRGGSSGSARYDMVYGLSGSPNSVQHVQQTQSTAPSVSTWNYALTPPNGAAADIASGLVLAWTFTDVDPGQTQGSYALSRQIGAGALAYWRASDSTWQPAEVLNASATPQVTIPATWGADADANHQFRVKVADSLGVQASGYSEATAVIPSVKVNPAVTAPTGGATLTADSVTITWTAAEQTAYRVRLTQTSVTPNVVVYDSGKVIGTVNSLTVPYSMANGTAWTVELTTYNNEGLASTAQTRAFTVSYAPPPSAVPVLTPVPASGWMSVASSTLAPVGTQPAITSQDLYRRVKLYSTLNPNPAMAGNVTGWTGIGGTLSYSTTQSYSAPGSARLVPTGAAPDSLVRLLTPIDVADVAAAGGILVARGWIRPDTANKSMRIEVDFYDSGGTLLGFVPFTFTAVVAGAWQYIRATADFTTYPSATKAGVSIGLTGTPAAGDAFYADDVTLRRSNLDQGVRVAQLLGAGATLSDWNAPGATDLEYRWVAKGANGTTQTGPWTG